MRGGLAEQAGADQSAELAAAEISVWCRVPPVAVAPSNAART